MVNDENSENGRGEAERVGASNGDDGLGKFNFSHYKPPGPVARAFIMSTKVAPFIMGPVGSGKTTAALFKCLRYSAMMPVCRDGVIRAKGAIVRADYRTLYKTTIPSWHSWFPPDFPGSSWTGGADRPAVHDLSFHTPRGKKIHLIVEFQALGDKRIEDVLRGWEGSWALMEEADLLDESALNFLIQRTTRYPARRLLEDDARLRPCVIGSLNPPGTPDHWIVKRFIDHETVTGDGSSDNDLQLFVQPSGLSPEAENLSNLQTDYYEIIARNMPSWDVQRFVHGKIGWDRSGQPVYPEFDPRFNLAPKKLLPLPGVQIYLGFDCSGLHPAAIAVQRAPSLQLRVLQEFYFGRMGPTRFVEHLAAELETTYRDNSVALGFYDPTNDFGADKEGGEMSWIDILRKALGIPLLPAPSNEIPLRIETVRNLLVTPIDADNRALLVSAQGCKWLVEGFLARYRFRLNPDGTLAGGDSPRPQKNEHANVHDALQYVCLGLMGRAGQIASAAKGMRPGNGNGRPGGATILKADFKI